jgi:hypothetical protein
MNKTRIRAFLDFVPFLILVISAIILVIRILILHQSFFHQRHFVGFIFLALTTIIFYKNHALGVLVLGITILLGLFGYLSFSIEFIKESFYVKDFKFLAFQPIFLLWIIIHFVLSGRHYVGIGTKKYWDSVLNWNNKFNK